MECRRCHTRLPEVAHFCHVCGQDMRSQNMSRRDHFAMKPDEPVASFAIVSTIMPRGAGSSPQTYRTALLIALAAALLTSIFGALPIAVLLAAFAIPIVYIVYLYDVNLWKDAPVPVTGMGFALTAILTGGFIAAVRAFGPQAIGFEGALDVVGVLVAIVLVPIVGEVIRQIGPLFLASRPRFDDLMDGVTFGIISGVAYATADTLVRHWSLITGGFAGSGDVGLWMFLVVLEGFVKPLLIGTATGIACAEFAGLGRGYDGFSLRWLRGSAEAIGANAIYNLGIVLSNAFLESPAVTLAVQLIVGLVVLAVLIIRIRGILHIALLEAALEASARGGVGSTEGVGEEGELGFCPSCEMPLLEHSTFCSACGTAVRETAPRGRRKAGERTLAPEENLAGAGAGEATRPTEEDR